MVIQCTRIYQSISVQKLLRIDITSTHWIDSERVVAWTKL
jgi:hypothetical protein